MENHSHTQNPDARRQTYLDRGPEQMQQLESLVHDGKRAEVLAIVSDWHPGDVVELMSQLPFREAQQLLSWLPAETGGQALAKMDAVYRTTLLTGYPLPKIIQLVDVLETDDATDVVSNLPPELRRKVIPALDDDREVSELLGYAEDTAGGIMSARYLSVPPDSTIAEATQHVREHAGELQDIFALFVTDREGVLQGALDLKTLLLSPAGTRVSEVMDPDVRSVRVDVDQEHVAGIMERYDLVSLPVTDAHERLVGCITIDDAVDVIVEEAREDLSHVSGAPRHEQANLPTWKVALGRLPWLLAGLAGAGLSGAVVGSFEEALRRAVVLAGFIPVVMAMAGNAGIQSASVAVQGLATGSALSVSVGKRIGRELLTSLLNGLVLAITLTAILVAASGFLNVEAPTRLALTAGSSLLVVIFVAGAIGATAPALLHRLGIDPALATGPIITTSNDVLGVLVFFSFSSWLYLG